MWRGNVGKSPDFILKIIVIYRYFYVFFVTFSQRALFCQKVSYLGELIQANNEKFWKMDRRAILFLYVPGLHVAKLTKIQWTPRTKTCNVVFARTLVLLRIPQRAIMGSCFEVRKIERTPCTICGFRLQFWIPRQLKFTKHVYDYLYMVFFDLWTS